MRDFIQNQRQIRDYDDWFRYQVQMSMGDTSKTVPHDQVMSEMKIRLSERMAQEDKENKLCK